MTGGAGLSGDRGLGTRAGREGGKEGGPGPAGAVAPGKESRAGGGGSGTRAADKADPPAVPAWARPGENVKGRGKDGVEGALSATAGAARGLRPRYPARGGPASLMCARRRPEAQPPPAGLRRAASVFWRGGCYWVFGLFGFGLVFFVPPPPISATSQAGGYKARPSAPAPRPRPLSHLAYPTAHGTAKMHLPCQGRIGRDCRVREAFWP